MHYIYNLYFAKEDNFYSGYTYDLKRRICEHRQGKVKSTKHKGKFCLIHYEAYYNKEDAIKREKYFKTTKGKRILRLMLKYSLNEVKIGPVVT